MQKATDPAAIAVRKPRYLEIVQRIEARRTDLTEPLKLPPEPKMAADYKIARDTLRRAMVLLQERGAVTRRRGRGTFLRPLHARPANARGNTIGFVPPWWAKSLNAWYTATLFDGISHWADENDCRLSVLQVERHENDEHKLLDKLAARNLAGLLWIHPVPEQVELLAAVSRHVPCVVVGREYSDIDLHAVLPDYQHAAILLDEHLVSKGHLNYSIVARSTADPYGASWLTATREAFRRRGAFFDDQDYFLNITPFDRDRLAALLLDFHFPKHPASRALILTSSSYLIPLLASERFREALPEQISIAAFDYGTQALGTYWPGKHITHVTCNWNDIARKAVDILCSLIQGRDAPKVIRQSVALMAGETVAQRINEDSPRGL